MRLQKISGGGITSPQGFTAGAAMAAIKKPDRYDLALVFSLVPAAAAGVYTTNKYQAAPVQLTKQSLSGGIARGIVANSGCANACTGEEGLRYAKAMAEKSAEMIGCDPQEIAVASTGVIGVQLPMEKILRGIEAAGHSMSAENGHLAAHAIMTTDTFAKETALEFKLDGKKVRMGAMAKGSGMIHPNMATMLAFITTDAAITPRCLSGALSWANGNTFNMITVDGDTSTNDMLVVLANGMAGNNPIYTAKSLNYLIFREALAQVCTDLAKMIARDGEGATKLFEVQVLHALRREDAKRAAKSIAGSNLVKAAMFGEDANWGRIICALGYSGADFDPDTVDVYLGDVKVSEDGCGLAFDEARAAKILHEKEVVVTVDLKQGDTAATAWGCDLTYDYVKINGSYRT